MCEQEDIKARRARDRERWHDRAATRKKAGLCQSCGCAEVAPGRTRCEPCLQKRRIADRARHHKRTAARLAAGACPRCGRRPPEPGRSTCSSCAARDNAASRARDARLRAEGKPRRDPAREKRYQRERRRRLHELRKSTGTCVKCGRVPARPGRTTCEPCAEKHRARDRSRHARAKAKGLLYGGRDPEAKRKSGRESSRRRTEARKAAGKCIRCGHGRPEAGRSMCEPCRENRRQSKKARRLRRRAAGLCVRCAAPSDGKELCKSCAAKKNRRPRSEARREADRQRYNTRRAQGICTSCGSPSGGAAECPSCREAARKRYESRRAAGVCVRCQAPTFDGAAQCAACSVARSERRDREAEYAARRRQYADRRARGRCVSCEAPSPGAARCEPCARKHAESSGTYRGIPVWDPQYTVVELATGREHGPFDSLADVALCLAFAKLPRDEVEVIADAPVTAQFTAPQW